MPKSRLSGEDNMRKLDLLSGLLIPGKARGPDNTVPKFARRDCGEGKPEPQEETTDRVDSHSAYLRRKDFQQGCCSLSARNIS
jgi:hypothetical protein